jgi:sec-independent protein translocase protein tatA/E homolog
MIGYTELILIFLVVFLLFGAKRIPELAKALGKASHEFKKAKDGLVSETEEMMNAAEKNAEAEDKLKQNGGTKNSQD